MRASARFGVREAPAFQGSAAVARRRRGGRSRTERLQDSFALRIELLGFKRQSRPGPCHVGQDGAHPQVRRAISHLPAFDGTLSALDRSNHRHPAAHAHRPRGRRSTLYDNCNRSSHMDRSWNEKNFIAMSRIPDRRPRASSRFRLMEPRLLSAGAGCVFNPGHPSGRRLRDANSIDSIAMQAHCGA
jgi:hypothetical protein